MPWSNKQHKLFEAAAHNPAVAKRVGIPQGQAQKMASEGVKRETIKALRKKVITDQSVNKKKPL
jgi:hypothetical protein